jgi:hypothetical protein
MVRVLERLHFHLRINNPDRTNGTDPTQIVRIVSLSFT